MTAANQVDPLTMGAEHPYRSSLKRYVTEKWGVTDEIENDESEDSEGETVSTHFRAALSNAALKLRFSLRHHKDKAPNSVHTTDTSDNDTDDGRSLISALSKTANTISSTLKRTSSFIKTPSQRSLVEQLSTESNERSLLGTQIGGKSLTLLHHDCDDDGSTTSSLDSFNDSSEVASPIKVRREKPDDQVMISSHHRHSVDHKRHPTKSKAACSSGHTGRSRRTTRSKVSSHGENEEKIDEESKESCHDHDAATEESSPKTSRRTAPALGRRGVARTRSLHEESKHCEHREHRATRTHGAAEDKGPHNESHGNERRRGVYRTASMQKEHRERESGHQLKTSSSRTDMNGDEKPRGVHRSASLHGIDKVRSRRSGGHRARYAITLEKTGTRNESSDEKTRGIARSKSHDVIHMRKPVETANAQWH